MLQQHWSPWFVGGQHESVPNVEIGLGIYGLLEDKMIVPKLELGVHHLHGPR